MPEARCYECDEKIVASYDAALTTKYTTHLREAHGEEVDTAEIAQYLKRHARDPQRESERFTWGIKVVSGFLILIFGVLFMGTGHLGFLLLALFAVIGILVAFALESMSVSR